MLVVIPLIASLILQDRAIRALSCITDALIQALSDAAGRNGQTLAAVAKLSYRLVVSLSPDGIRATMLPGAIRPHHGEGNAHHASELSCRGDIVADYVAR